MESMHPRNQLDRVVCQLRFPAKLQVDREVYRFQDMIDGEYPNFAREKIMESPLLGAPSDGGYEFSSADGGWKVYVSLGSLSLTTSNYTSWDEFEERFKVVFAAFQSVFPIQVFNRVGLRYINAIRPSMIGADVGWVDILQPPFSTMYEMNLGKVKGINAVVDYDMGEGITGRTIVGSIVFSDGENGILVDDDVYVMGDLRIVDVSAAISKLNAASKDVFRAVTTERLQKEVGL